jgi:hypothetical protein
VRPPTTRFLNILEMVLWLVCAKRWCRPAIDGADGITRHAKSLIELTAESLGWIARWYRLYPIRSPTMMTAWPFAKVARVSIKWTDRPTLVTAAINIKFFPKPGTYRTLSYTVPSQSLETRRVFPRF